MLTHLVEVTRCESHVLQQNPDQLDDFGLALIRDGRLAQEVFVPVVSFTNKSTNLHRVVRISNHRFDEP